MKNKLTHFAIYIDDLDRAKNFYSEVFEWGFNSYGHPDFLQIKTNNSENAQPIGALQSRKYSPLSEKVIGFECTISVENIDETIEKVISYGGKVVLAKTVIPQVGFIAKFLDTEGNLICAMQHNDSAK